MDDSARNQNPHSIGFSGRQRSLDCQRRLPLYFPCAPSSQLRHLSENNLNNISSLKIYHLIRGNLIPSTRRVFRQILRL